MTVDTEVFVIGAGPAGLTAAYCLTKAAQSVIVIERDPVYVGGISRTVDYKGYLFDIGGHRFFSKSQGGGGAMAGDPARRFHRQAAAVAHLYNGKFFAYPLRAFEALFKLGLFTSAACMLSYAYAKLFPVTPARTFHEWVRNQFGERLFQIFFKTYTEKVWGMSCDEISADWAAQRIKGLDLTTAVLDGLKRSLRLGRKVPTRVKRERRHR
jgi:protoporphyrinogen oxidase